VGAKKKRRLIIILRLNNFEKPHIAVFLKLNNYNYYFIIDFNRVSIVTFFLLSFHREDRRFKVIINKLFLLNR